MIKREIFDQEQAELDEHVKQLRKQIPPRGDSDEEGKPLSALERLRLERELEESRHPRREPERKVAFAPRPSESQVQPEPAPKARPKRVAILEEEQES